MAPRLRRRLRPVPGARIELDNRGDDIGGRPTERDRPLVDLRWAPDPSGTTDRLRVAASTGDVDELRRLVTQGVAGAEAVTALVLADESELHRILGEEAPVPRHLPLDLELCLTSRLRLVWPFGSEAVGAAAAVLAAAGGRHPDGLDLLAPVASSVPGALVHVVLLHNMGDGDAVAAQGDVDVFDNLTAVITIVGAVALRDACRDREALIGLDAVLRHDGLGRTVLRLARLERARTRAAVGDVAGARDDLERLLAPPGRDIAARKALASLRTDAVAADRATPPEELELRTKEAVSRSLEAELLEAEVALATLEAELETFAARHHDVLAARYLRLDQLLAREAELRAARGDLRARRAADAARRQASSTETTVDADADRDRTVSPPDDEIKRLYRDVARRLHPDLAGDDADRRVRERLMADVNAAYARGDGEAILRAAQAYAERAEAVVGDDLASRLVRAIRSAARVRSRLAQVVEAYETLLASPLAHLQRQVEDAAVHGHDLLAEMASEVDAEIDAARQRLAELTGDVVGTV